eukprot:6046599-Amphidinium_carterae.1
MQKYGQLSEYLSGFSSYVAEGFLAKVLEDGRAAGRARELKEALAQDFMYIESVDETVWCSLAQHLQWDGEDMRSKLVEGAVTNNLALLALDDSDTSDPVTCKIRGLLQSCASRSMLSKAVCLLQECTWTTALTEKQHSGVAFGSTSVPFTISHRGGKTEVAVAET